MGCEVPHKSTQILPDSAVLQKTDLNFSRGRIEIGSFGITWKPRLQGFKSLHRHLPLKNEEFLG